MLVSLPNRSAERLLCWRDQQHTFLVGQLLLILHIDMLRCQNIELLGFYTGPGVGEECALAGR